MFQFCLRGFSISLLISFLHVVCLFAEFLHYMSVIQFDFDVSPLAFRLELKLSECPRTS